MNENNQKVEEMSTYTHDDNVELSTCFHILRAGGLDEREFFYYGQRLRDVMKTDEHYEEIVRAMGLPEGDTRTLLSLKQSPLICLSCEFCDNTYETRDEEELDFDDQSGTWSKPCGKCIHTMWSENK